MKTLALSIFTLAVTLIAAMFVYTTYLANASVITGGEYTATVLTSADVGTSTVRSLHGSIGSLVISSSSPAVGQPIRLFNTSSTTVATSTLTALVEIYPQTDEGTYQFDVAFGAGILIDVPTGFNGHAVLTSR